MMDEFTADLNALEALSEELNSDLTMDQVKDICDRAQPYAKRLLSSKIDLMHVRDILSVFTPYLRKIGRLG